MKDNPENRKIAMYGLGRYNITETGSVTIAATGSTIPKSKDEDDNEYVFLSYMARERRKYNVEELLQKTFKDLYQPYDHLSKKIGLHKVGQFSISEDDYGSEDGRHMREIREHVQRLKKITNYESDREEDEDANLE